MTSSPLPRMSNEGLIDLITEPFSAFVFKIQANMNKAHRDRIAFMRVCSGKFDADKDVYHVQSGRKLKLSTAAADNGAGQTGYTGGICG